MSLKVIEGIYQNPIATKGAAITTSDVTVYTEPFVGLYVGGAGAVKVDMIDMDGTVSSGLVFSGVAAGQTLPIAVNRIYATGTTATLIIGLK